MRMILGFACVLAMCVAVGCGGGDGTNKDADDAAKKAGAGKTDGGKDDGGASNKKDGSAKNGSTPGNGAGASTNGGDSNSVVLNADNTKISFTGTKDDGKHDGGFKAVAGKIELSDEGPTIIDVTVETNSLFSDDKKLTNHLLGPDFFDVISFPKASLVSSKIEAASDGDTTHTLTANLTLHGKTNAVTIPLKVDQSADSFKLTGSFKISRKEFDFNYKPEMIHDDVEIHVEIDTSKK